MQYVNSTQHRGFTFLGLLVVIMIAGIGMAAVGVVWSQANQRDREDDLLFVGNAYKRAIGSYYEANKRYPKQLEELVLDESQENAKRHLRKLYQDPMTRDASWGLLKLNGGITGVYSTSTNTPIRTVYFDGAETYQGWVFKYEANVNNELKDGALYPAQENEEDNVEPSDDDNVNQPPQFKFRTWDDIQQEIDRKYAPYKENPDLVQDLWQKPKP